VLTQFFLGADIDLIGDKLHANTMHFPVMVTSEDRRLKQDEVAGEFYWEEIGRIERTPAVLKGLDVSQVVIRQRMNPENLALIRDVGPYKIKGASAYVERTVPPSQNPTFGNMQFITITGDTLGTANTLLDAIYSRQVSPFQVELPISSRKRILSWIQSWRREPFAG
jgi:hypothetical protein